MLACFRAPVCYALFIYLLNLFLAFLQPKFDPSLYDDLASQDIEEGEPGLPTSASASGNFPSGAGKAGFGGGAPPNPGGGGGLMSGVFGGGGGVSGNNAGSEEEFRPFIRRLPEFKVSAVYSAKTIIPLICVLIMPLPFLSHLQFWLSATQAIVIALLCTLTYATDVPVYWPILLMYFLLLFGLTMKRQIK